MWWIWSSAEKAVQSRCWFGGSIEETGGQVHLQWGGGGIWVNRHARIERFAIFVV